MRVDKALQSRMEELFLSSEARVVTAMEVTMWQGGPSWSVGKPQKGYKDLRKARVLCVTVKRNKASRGYKCTLHVIKHTDSGDSPYQVKKSWGMKHLSRMEVLTAGEGGGEQPEDYQLFALTFTSSMGTGLSETRLVYGVQSSDDRLIILACLYKLGTEHDRRAPAVLGTDIADLERMARTPAAVELLGEFGADLLPLDEGQAGPSGGKEGTEAQTPTAISSKEERDLQNLMETFQVGVGDVEEFMERLGDELRALEAANVHSILEGNELVAVVLKLLDKTRYRLDDLEAEMSVYNFRLQHMREDIAAIELRNNRLELAAQNSEALLQSLKSTLAHLSLPGGIETTLLNADFSNRRGLDKVVEAAWDLRTGLQRLSPGGASSLSEDLLRMKAIRERHEHLSSNAKHFVRRAFFFLSGQFNTIGARCTPEEVQADFQDLSLSNNSIHQECRQFIPLVEVMQALEPPSLQRLRTEYTKAANMLLRRQIRACSASMRAAIRVNISQSAREVDLSFSRRRGSSIRRMPSPFRRRHSRTESLDTAGLRTPSPISGTPVDTPNKGPVTLASTMSLDRVPTLTLSQMGDVEARRLDEAFLALLDTFVPLLLKEADFAVELLLLGRAQEETTARARQTPSQSSQPDSATSTPAQTPQRRSSSQGGSRKTPRSSRRMRSMLSMPRCSGTDLGPEGLKVIEGLMAGIDSELFHIVDLTNKSHQQLCLPMLGGTLRHQEKRMLTECEKRLRLNLDSFVSERVTHINKFDCRGAMSSSTSLKSINVASFVQSFGPLITRLEDFIWSCKTDEASTPAKLPTARHREPPSPEPISGSMASSVTGTSSSAPNTPTGRSRRSTADTLSSADAEETSVPSLLSTGSFAGGLSLRARFAGTGGSGLTPSTQLRNVMDDVYGRLLTAMASAVERLAATDAKYGNKFRLENYAALLDAVSHHANSVPALAHFRNRFTKAREGAIQGYVREQLEYCRLWGLLSFGERLNQLLPDVGADEVKFQMNFSPDDLTSLLHTTMSGIEKKLSLIRARIVKHFSHQPEEFIASVWGRCTLSLLQRYRRLEANIGVCYPGIAVSPSPAELEGLLRAAKSSGDT